MKWGGELEALYEKIEAFTFTTVEEEVDGKKLITFSCDGISVSATDDYAAIARAMYMLWHQVRVKQAERKKKP